MKEISFLLNKLGLWVLPIRKPKYTTRSIKLNKLFKSLAIIVAILFLFSPISFGAEVLSRAKSIINPSMNLSNEKDYNGNTNPIRKVIIK